jgi:hypothetical protein
VNRVEEAVPVNLGFARPIGFGTSIGTLENDRRCETRPGRLWPAPDAADAFVSIES